MLWVTGYTGLIGTLLKPSFQQIGARLLDIDRSSFDLNLNGLKPSKDEDVLLHLAEKKYLSSKEVESWARLQADFLNRYATRFKWVVYPTTCRNSLDDPYVKMKNAVEKNIHAPNVVIVRIPPLLDGEDRLAKFYSRFGGSSMRLFFFAFNDEIIFSYRSLLGNALINLVSSLDMTEEQLDAEFRQILVRKSPSKLLIRQPCSVSLFFKIGSKVLYYAVSRSPWATDFKGRELKRYVSKMD